MKEAIKDSIKLKKLSKEEIIKEIGRQLLFCAFAFLMSRGRVLGGILPFGAAFVAAVPVDYLALSTVGSFLGYLTAPDINNFRYMAALFGIVAIKALLCSLTKFALRPIITALTAGIVTCATGLVSTVGDDKQTALCFAEGVFAFAGAYFLSCTVRSYPAFLKGAKGEDLTCLLISVNMLLIGTMAFTPGNISIGKILALTFILTVSRYGRSFAGAVCGIAAAFAVALSGESTATALTFSLAGLMAGVFAPFGKYAQIASLITSCLIGSALGQELIAVVELFIESLFASAIYLVLPKSVVALSGKVFSPRAKTVSGDGMKKAVTMRLRFASTALSDVSRTIETVASELSRINSPDFDGLLHGIETDACSGCSLRVNCWENRKADTASAVLDMIKSVREGRTGSEELAPEDFKMRCLRPAKVGDAVLTHYTDYASRMAAESRIADVRSVVSEQFDGISDMLCSMAEEFEREEAFDERSAAKIISALKNIEMIPTECSCRIDKYGRMTVEIILEKIKGAKYSRMKLLRQIELCCDRDFEPPTVSDGGDKLYITLTERAVIAVTTGVCQIAASPSGISGDAYSVFSDGKGRSITLLCDGMGCGGRAAVDGAMASGLMTRLLKAGFGYDCSLSILSSAMLFKSTDESLSTVDVASLDLFSGRLDMLKAGAAPTIVRRAGRCSVAKSTSLPVGILREVGFDKATIKLKAGDIILMMSDGVTSEGIDWICAELESFEDGTAEALAEKIAYGAKRRRTDNHADDITVVAVMVEKAV